MYTHTQQSSENVTLKKRSIFSRYASKRIATSFYATREHERENCGIRIYLISGRTHVTRRSRATKTKRQKRNGTETQGENTGKEETKRTKNVKRVKIIHCITNTSWYKKKEPEKQKRKWK